MAVNPSPTSTGPNTGILDSRSNQLVLLSIGLIIGLVLIGIVVKVIWHTDVIQEIAVGSGFVTGNTGAGVFRNLKVDSPIRQQYAALDVAVQAKDAGVEVPNVFPTPQATTAPINPGPPQPIEAPKPEGK